MSEIQIANVDIRQISTGHQPRDGVAPDSVLTMASSFERDGQLSPIGVEKSGQGFVLRYGNTRFLAAKHLEWPTILARVFPSEGSAGDALRMSVVENTVREQMTFVELADVIFEYSKLTKLTLQDAGAELGFKQPQISKCVKTNERLTAASKKKLLEAGVGGSLAYEISKEIDPARQSDLVDIAIREKWTRKQIEAHFRQKKSANARIEYRSGAAKVTVDIPKHATPNDIITALKKLAADVNKQGHLQIPTLARVLKEQSHVLSS